MRIITALIMFGIGGYFTVNGFFILFQEFVKEQGFSIKALNIEVRSNEKAEQGGAE